jgi:excisionase family DNA binding protein
MDLDDVIDLHDAATELGLSGTTLRYQASVGRLAAKVVGKTWITTRQEVERYRRENLGRRGRPRTAPVSAGDAVPNDPRPAGMLTLAEAGERLGVAGTTLRNQVRRGSLEATLVGKTYLVAPDEIERYRADHLGQQHGGYPKGRKRKDHQTEGTT